METLSNRKLTSVTAAHVNWRRIDGVFGVLVSERKGDASTAETDQPLSDHDREVAKRAFDVAKGEFGKTIAWISVINRYAIFGIVLALAFAVAGGVLLQLTGWASLISIASLASLLGLLPLMFGLARDQAMLELIPSRYELALALCTTKRELRGLQTRFLDETSSLRKR